VFYDIDPTASAIEVVRVRHGKRRRLARLKLLLPKLGRVDHRARELATSEKPWISRMSTSKIGAITPACAYIGKKPITSVEPTVRPIDDVSNAPADAVADMTEHDTAHRASDEADREHRERQDLLHVADQPRERGADR